MVDKYDIVIEEVRLAIMRHTDEKRDAIEVLQRDGKFPEKVVKEETKVNATLPPLPGQSVLTPVIVNKNAPTPPGIPAAPTLGVGIPVPPPTGAIPTPPPPGLGFVPKAPQPKKKISEFDFGCQLHSIYV